MTSASSHPASSQPAGARQEEARTAPFDLRGLSASIDEAEPHLARSRRAALKTAGQAATTTNAEGGDPTSHADPTLLARHLGHYLAAAEIASAVLAASDAGDREDSPAGPATGERRLLDVGCGTGAYSAWLSERLRLPLHLADHDPGVLAAATAVHDVAGTHLDLAAAPRATVVTAMEVLEHIPPDQQQGFLDAAVDRLAPGGVLVLSTPDESHYPGGWSGYAPHIGCVVADQLRDMLQQAAGDRPVEVWRLTGGPYDVSQGRRLLESVANRVWTQVTTRAPAVAARLAATSVRGEHVARPVLSAAMVTGLDRVRVTHPDDAVGGAMIGVVRG